MNNKRKFLNAALASTLVLSSLTLNVSAEKDSVVKRLAGDTRVETSQVVSKEVHDSANTVVVAGYHGMVDALTGTILAGKEEAPLLVVSEKQADIDVIKDEITRLGAKNAIILGDQKVVSENVANQLADMGLNVERKGGQDRFDTAVEIAKLAGSSHNHVFLTNDGRSGELADALASGPVSARQQDPILLTSQSSVPSQTLDALKDLSVKEITIIGGKVAVDGKVESQLKDAGYTVNRVAGDTRWETAVEVANTYFKDNDKVTVANDGRVSYADALVGGYLGASEYAPILLTQDHKLNEVTENYLGENASFAYVLGGEKVVSKDVASSIEQIILDNAQEEVLEIQSISVVNGTVTVVFSEDVTEVPEDLTITVDGEDLELDAEVVDGKVEITVPEIEASTENITVVKYAVTLGETTKEATLTVAAKLTPAEPIEFVVENVEAKDATTIVVTFEDVEEPVEFTVEEMTHGENEVEFTYNGYDYVATVNYADPAVVALEAAKEEAIAELKAAGITSDFYFDLINKAKTVEGVESLKNEILQNVAVQAATEAVEKAEETRTQEDVDAAGALVDELIDSDAKDALEERLAAIQAELDLSEATEAVEAYETKVNSTEKVVVLVQDKGLRNEASALKTPAFNKVQKLKGEEKDALLERLDVAHNRIIAATAVSSLQTATENLTEATLDNAKIRLSNAKTNVRFLEDEALEEALNDLIALEEAKINELVAVIEAVEAAEESQTQADVRTARKLVEALDEGQVQDALEARLVEVEEKIEAVGKVRNADTQIALDAALSNTLFEGYNPELIANYLADNNDDAREALVTVADVNEFIKNVNEAVANEEAEDAFRAELLAQGKKGNLSFYNYLNSNYDNVEKDDAYVDAYRVALFATSEDPTEVKTNIKKKEDVQAAINLVNATQAVESLVDEEGNLVADQAAIDAAQDLVDALPEDKEGETTKADLQAGIDAAQENFDLNEAVAEATAAVDGLVVDGELIADQAAIDAAQELVDALPAETDTTVLEGKIDAAQNLLDLNIATEAVEALVDEEGNLVADQAAIDAAQELVDALPAETDTTVLEGKIDTAQGLLDAANLEAATEAVEALVDEEGNLVADQAAIDAAQELIDALPAETDTTVLEGKIDAAQNLLDAANLEAATEAVEALVDEEGNLIADQSAIDAAQELVDALPVETNTTELQNKIDAAQELLYVDSALSAATVTEMKSVIDKINTTNDYRNLSYALKMDVAEIALYVLNQRVENDPDYAPEYNRLVVDLGNIIEDVRAFIITDGGAINKDDLTIVQTVELLDNKIVPEFQELTIAQKDIVAEYVLNNKPENGYKTISKVKKVIDAGIAGLEQ